MFSSNKTWIHDDIIAWKHFSCYWPFVRGIHRSPVNSPNKGQWCGDLMFCSVCAWINGWENNGDTSDFRCHHSHYDKAVMNYWEKGRDDSLMLATLWWYMKCAQRAAYDLKLEMTGLFPKPWLTPVLTVAGTPGTSSMMAQTLPPQRTQHWQPAPRSGWNDAQHGLPGYPRGLPRPSCQQRLWLLKNKQTKL